MNHKSKLYAAFRAECLKADMDAETKLRSCPRKPKARVEIAERNAPYCSRYAKIKKDPVKLEKHREQSRKWQAEHRKKTALRLQSESGAVENNTTAL